MTFCASKDMGPPPKRTPSSTDALDNWVGSQMLSDASLVSAAFSFVCAPDGPVVSQGSSAASAVDASAPLKRETACFAWHLITVATALAKSLPMALEHFSWFSVFDTHPLSSVAHDVVPPSVQSKCCPGPGGA